MKLLGLIPARGGSKGVPNKNLKPLLGKSLIQRTFENAKLSNCLDKIILSTDNLEILNHAKDIGLEVPFIRPSNLSSDIAPMIGVAQHALTKLEETGEFFDAILLLQPTSPLRTIEHIKTASKLIQNCDSVCSVIPIPLTHCPHYVMKIDCNGILSHFLPSGKNITRRQDVPRAFTRDGTIYCAIKSVLFETNSFYGSNCKSIILNEDESISIDTESDWSKAEKILQNQILLNNLS